MLRKILTTSLTLVLTVALTGCGGASTKETAQTPVPKTITAAAAAEQSAVPALQGKKILIAYFSYSNNTYKTAQLLQNKIGGDFFAIEPATPYSTTDYRSVDSQGLREVRSGYKPPLKNKLANIADYDVIFLGSPIWWGTMAPPVATFLGEHDLANKTVVPFCTHGGYGAGSYFADTAKAAPNARVLTGLALDRRSVPGAALLNADGVDEKLPPEELQKYPPADSELDNWLQNLQL
ncbi:flavodoxin [uncultured Phascolarctobacterium sp.]|uniref:flavodoxin n=1 Tax=uncultured Phascolarctobacterium sp. TaxID=512296 RepID=UPI002619A32F|nr:flavodoxin [uncultured Phascolarctobacterium sp.]